MNSKLFFILLALSSLIISCTDVILEKEIPINGLNNNDYQISVNDILVLLHADSLKMTKNTNEVTIEPFVWDRDTVMYLVNDSKGWQLISADKRACPIVAYSEGEHLSLQEMQKASYLHNWVSNVAKEIFILKNGNFPIENENTKYWDYVTRRSNKVRTKVEGQGWRWFCRVDVSYNSTEINHIIPTKWSGDDPWNIFPNGYDGFPLPVGSHNVAIAQILYWANQHLSTPTYSYTNVTGFTDYYSYYDGDETLVFEAYPVFSFNDSSSLAWAQMKTTYLDSGSSDYVGYLMAKVRSLTNPFSPEGYSASTDVNALNYFNMDASFGNYVADTVVNRIMQGNPSIIITDVNSNEYYHTRACIADAYFRYSSTYEDYYIYDPNNTFDFGEIQEDLEDLGPDEVLIILPEGYDWCSEQNTITLRYLSFNWGLDGIGDNTKYSVYSTLWDWVHYNVTTNVSPNKMIYGFHTLN